MEKRMRQLCRSLFSPYPSAYASPSSALNAPFFMLSSLPTTTTPCRERRKSDADAHAFPPFDISDDGGQGKREEEGEEGPGQTGIRIRLMSEEEQEDQGTSGMVMTSQMKWVLVVLSIAALIVGQSVALLLSRYYFDNGGSSRWLSTLLQCVGWPILVIPLLFYYGKESANRLTPFTTKLVFIYVALGLLLAADNLAYSWGISFMPASTYSLLCSSQLAFNAVFALVLVKQKIGPYTLNSLVILTFSAVLLGVQSDGGRPAGVNNVQYIIGFVCTVAASAMYGLILPLMQLVFKRVIKKETFAVVLEMQIYTSIVATAVCVIGLFISGESQHLKEEASNFTKGKVAYYMTLVWSAIGWQVCSVGVVSLIFVVSSLFSNVISTLSLPVVPLLSVWFFHDKMHALKIISLLLSVWGFVSYIYGGYVDSKSATNPKNNTSVENRQSSSDAR
uniref:Probable purine permease n=1 Tax=Araucaria cunninghamii TaxID=56994 RepID=A0A0D6QVX5_ARACU